MNNSIPLIYVLGFIISLITSIILFKKSEGSTDSEDLELTLTLSLFWPVFLPTILIDLSITYGLKLVLNYLNKDKV